MNDRQPSAHGFVTAGDFVVKAGWTLGPRLLHDCELVYFPAGSATQYRVGDEAFTLEQPCFIMTRPAEEHAYIFDPNKPTRHLFVHFLPDSLTGGSALSSLLSPGGRSWIPAGHASVVPSLIRQILHLAASKPHRWEERCRLLLHAALGEIEALGDPGPDPESACSRPAPSQITKALQYMDSRLHLPLSIAAIAGHVGWTHEHFTRMFVQHTGMTPQKAIARRRIDRACQLLMQTVRPVKQIAYEVGFQDEHYFSRCFVRIKGMTASDYRDRFADPRVRHLAPVEDYESSYPMNRIIK